MNYQVLSISLKTKTIQLQKTLLIFILYTIIIKGAFAQKDLLCGFRKGLQEGTCKSFYENGQLQNSVEWEKGKQHGKALFYHPNGKLQAEGAYKKGFRKGEWKYYDENGFLNLTENYKVIDNTQNLHGSSIFYYPNGKIKNVRSYKNNKLDGEDLAYYENGNLSGKTVYKNGIIIGDISYFYEKDGALYSKGPAIAMPSDNKILATGKWYFYYEDGKTVKDVGEYDKDLQIGKWQGFHKNGKLRAESTFINGKKEGKRLLYDENGTLTATELYKNGELVK